MDLNYIEPLRKSFESHANPDNAIPMKKYMKNLFEYYGIKSPERRVLCREFLKSSGLPEKKNLKSVIEELWDLPQREYQYFAMDLLEKFTKQFEPDDIHLLEKLVLNKSWWDTVDFIAVNLIGSYFQRFPKDIKKTTEEWISSTNMWLQRSAILFQLKYKAETDLNLLFTYIKRCSNSDEFFIRKAIGWALREYSKTDPNVVIDFVNEYPLKPLSKREALKWLQRKESR